MATAAYLIGRKKWQRPQGLLWSNNPGTLDGGIYTPNGYEVGAEVPEETDPNLIDQFLVLSDHNRGEISFTNQRIEQKQRTINGRMRSYYIADKLNISISWNLLPSRSYNVIANFDDDGLSPLDPKYTKRKADGTNYQNTKEYTADGGAGGVAMLDWYNSHPGPFWLYLAYDKYSNFKTGGEITNASYSHLGEYNQIIQVYFADFNYSIVKRGGNDFDLWNISVVLEEV
jgi:hypothetical protein